MDSDKFFDEKASTLQYGLYPSQEEPLVFAEKRETSHISLRQEVEEFHGRHRSGCEPSLSSADWPSGQNFQTRIGTFFPSTDEGAEATPGFEYLAQYVSRDLRAKSKAELHLGDLRGLGFEIWEQHRLIWWGISFTQIEPPVKTDDEIGYTD